MKNRILVLGLALAFIILLGATVALLQRRQSASQEDAIVDFDSCVAAGFPILESYPQQCRTEGGKVFIENIGNELEKVDLIQLAAPRPNQVVNSPLVVAGEARGTWFFEADFPVKILDQNGELVAIGIAQADGEWMTEDFVPFQAVIEFDPPITDRGRLVLEKDNPSGLPEHDDELNVPIRFR